MNPNRLLACSAGTLTLGAVISLAFMLGGIGGLNKSAHTSFLTPSFVVQIKARSVLRAAVLDAPSPPAKDAYKLRTEEDIASELAAELAEKLGVRLELVVSPRNEHVSILESGRADILITDDNNPFIPASTGKPAVHRLPAAGTGYSQAPAAMLRSDTAIKSWGGLAGKTVCMAQANTAAARLTRLYGARAEFFPSPAESLAQMRMGNCDAAIHPAALAMALARLPGWEKFSAILHPADSGQRELVVAVANDAAKAELEALAGPLFTAGAWKARITRMAAVIALEVMLEQYGPDCH